MPIQERVRTVLTLRHPAPISIKASPAAQSRYSRRLRITVDALDDYNRSKALCIIV